MSLLKEYFRLQLEAENEFGPSSIVLMEIGSFMECYATETKGHAKRVANALNMVMTKKNKKFPVSESNPYLVGFPVCTHEKNVPVLLSHGMSVVWYSQVVEHGRIRRERTRVITPGTYVPKEDDGYHVCCVGEYTAAVIDTSVGKVDLHTIRSLEHLRWFKEAYQPVETILEKGVSSGIRALFENSTITFTNGNNYKDKTTQQAILEKVSYRDVMTDLPTYTETLACLLDFVWTCHSAVLKDIRYPVVADTDRMTLHNNLIPQLDVIQSHKGQGLLGLLKGYAKTAMGRRALRAKLLAPMTSVETIQNELDRVERAFDDLHHIRALSKIPDMERALKSLLTNHPSATALRDFHEGVFQMLELFPNPELSAAFLHARDATFPDDHELIKIRTSMQHTRQALEKALREPWFHNCKLDSFQIVTTKKRAATLHQNYPTLLRVRPLNATTSGVYTDDTEQWCAALAQSVDAESKRVTETIKNWVDEIREKYLSALCVCIQKVTELDVAIARAACARDLGLVRPGLCESVNSFVKGTNVRHPLIPKYIGNDVNLTNGLLLYGINGSGKTCHAKSIALNVILAQAGFFVFADSLTLAPFTKMFARINCDDDVYNGLSSFSVEMTELRSILRLADDRSLIIGDEMCKGTEDMSAVALVASCVRWIHDRGVKFVFATHQHKLPELVPEDIQIKHVRSEHRGGDIVFLRKLADGPGDTIYGIEVARHLLGLPEIANRAMEIRNALVGRNGRVKKSAYNKRVVVSVCQACESTTDLHTHHIMPQASFDKKTQRKQMNDKDNLMVLCHTCHDKVHRGELSVERLDTVHGSTNKVYLRK